MGSHLYAFPSVPEQTGQYLLFNVIATSEKCQLRHMLPQPLHHTAQLGLIPHC